MKNFTNYILDKTEKLNPVHAKKLRSNIDNFDEEYYKIANEFFDKYLSFLMLENKNLDYAINCYLSMISDMNIEAVNFRRSGKYSSSTFEEVKERVYANPEIMEYYMHGLIMSQFLWKHHYDLFTYFMKSMPRYIENTKNYLEIGAGHGLYLSKALEVLKNDTSFTVVDISKTCIDMTKKFTNDNRITFNLIDVFDFYDDINFDFITMGEVLEHVERPLELLNKLHTLLDDNGTIFITTPTNAPAIDHIYLFNNIMEIQNLITSAGFRIESEMSFFSEDVSSEKAERLKVCILYGAFLKKQ
jgi:2-polyprenyl-3-methyl-5-hydroxy-6-metoxy-1,4-benzoquinol methylase